MVRQLYYFIVVSTLTVFFISCTIQPVWKMTYLNENKYKGLPKTNGYYYFNYSREDSLVRFLDYMVFFENGLVKGWAIRFIEENFIEEKILEDLKAERYIAPHIMRTYIVRNDTLLMQYLLSTYVIVGDIGLIKGVFEGDSVLRIFEEQHNGLSFELNYVYKFHPFSTTALPDSTGYLYDKLQKKRAKELKKEKAQKKYLTFRAGAGLSSGVPKGRKNNPRP